MQGWMYVASFALGLVYLVYSLHSNNNNTNQPHQYGPHNRNQPYYYIDDDEEDDEEDDEVVNRESRNELEENNQENIENQPSTSRAITRGNIPQAIPEGEICPICRDQLVDKNVTKKYCLLVLPCNHWLHQKCALRLLEYHPACPVCRTSIDSNMLKFTPIRIPKQD